MGWEENLLRLMKMAFFPFSSFKHDFQLQIKMVQLLSSPGTCLVTCDTQIFGMRALLVCCGQKYPGYYHLVRDNSLFLWPQSHLSVWKDLNILRLGIWRRSLWYWFFSWMFFPWTVPLGFLTTCTGWSQTGWGQVWFSLWTVQRGVFFGVI